MYRRALTVVHGLAQFSVSKLFAALRGAWLEPQSGAMFTDTGGTTAVTTGGQSIARINDQSGWGNNATQATSANRPTYGARRNLLAYTEDFSSNLVWYRNSSSVTPNAVIAPDGNMTADKLIASSGTSYHEVIDFTGLVTYAGVKYTATVYMKAGEYNFGFIRLWNSIPAVNDEAAANYFDLIAGTTGNTNSNCTVDIKPANNGFYRCIVSFTPTVSSTQHAFSIGCAPNNGGRTFNGDGSSGIYIWGAQIEFGSVATPYQRVTTATDFDVGQYPAVRHDATDTLTCSLPDLGGGVFSSAGSVYFATPVGMSALHNQSMGTSYNLPALSTDIYSWMVFPQRLSAAQETQLERYMLGKAGLAAPTYLTDNTDGFLTDDSGNDIILAA